MPAVSETIVREYLEGLGFLVQQPRKYVVMARSKQPAEEIDFLAVNPLAGTDYLTPEPDQMLAGGAELRQCPRVMVSVRGWHTDKFSPATLELSPEIFRFTEPPVVREALKILGPGPLTKVLVLPALPTSRELASLTLSRLRERGVELVVLFPTMLRELARGVEVNRSYEKSELMQTLRILKNYDLLKEEQLELFRRPAGTRKRAAKPDAP